MIATTQTDFYIEPSIFRAYDIRGVVDESLTEPVVRLLGQVLGSTVLENGESKIMIGCDGRLSSPRLTKALCEGVLASGCDVMNIGMVPTPILYYSTYLLNVPSGVMVTGSHNPPDYNGFKMVIGKKTLSEEDIQHLYQRMIKGQYRQGHGEQHEVEIVDRYIEHIKQSTRISKPLKIVIDAGNGVAGKIAPALYRYLGCEVHELFCEIDGRFPNHHPDPSDPKNLKDLIKAVQDTNADVGLAFDGDGDRLGVVTSKGEVIWPDRILMLFAQALLKEVPGAKIIYDVKCSDQLGKLITELGGEPIMWKTGHSLIKAKLAQTHAALAGEMSGHFFFKNRWYGFDDALYAGARLLEILSAHSGDPIELFNALPNSVNTPELKVVVTDDEKFPLMQQLIQSANFSDAEIVTIDGLRVNFTDGWGLVRLSNTTPCLVLRFEAESIKVLTRIQELFRELLLTAKPGLVLPF
jgi:phosphomannomutase/phosphoglucomutase